MADTSRRSQQLCDGRAVRDVFGRSYRPGPSDQALLGHSRAWVAAAAWATMLAAGGTQYGYGAFAARAAHASGLRAVAWEFVLWVGCQSAASGTLPWLCRRFGITPPVTVTAGAVACALGLLALGRGGSPLLAMTAYAVAAGVGAGLVYGTCVATVAAWYPERPASTALVSGAFGYGAIPLILALGGTGAPSLPYSVLAWVIVVIAAACAPLLREPPQQWWPADLDPRRWAVDRTLNPALRQDPPPVRQHSPAQMLRAPVAWLMAAFALGVWAVALFDIAYLPAYGLASGWQLPASVVALAAFAAGSGGVRTLAVAAAGRLGRPRVLAAAMGTAAAAQLALAVAGSHRALALYWLAACCAGVATGTWFALLPGLVRSCFGDQHGLPNTWLVYSGKAAGGALGVGCAGWLITGAGYPAALIASAVVALSSGLLVPLLRRPGLLRTLPGTAHTAD